MMCLDSTIPETQIYLPLDLFFFFFPLEALCIDVRLFLSPSTERVQMNSPLWEQSGTPPWLPGTSGAAHIMVLATQPCIGTKN